MAKNNKLIGALILLSIGINFFFAYDEIKLKLIREAMDKAMRNLTINELSDFNHEIKKFYTENSPKKFIFLSTWADFCAPCIKEMPILDSMLKNNARISGYFITDITSPKKRFENMKLKNFNFLYDQNDLISSIHKRFGIKEKNYPLNLIVDSELNIYFFNGTGINFKSDTSLAATLRSINRFE